MISVEFSTCSLHGRFDVKSKVCVFYAIYEFMFFKGLDFLLDPIVLDLLGCPLEVQT